MATWEFNSLNACIHMVWLKLQIFFSFFVVYGPQQPYLNQLICSIFQAASLAKQGLHELETVINHAMSMGCKLQVNHKLCHVLAVLWFGPIGHVLKESIVI